MCIFKTTNVVIVIKLIFKLITLVSVLAGAQLIITYRLLASVYCMVSIPGYTRYRSAAGENDLVGNYIGVPEMKIGPHIKRVYGIPTHG